MDAPHQAVEAPPRENELLDDLYQRTPSYLVSAAFHGILLLILLLVPLPAEPEVEEELITPIIRPEEKKEERKIEKPERKPSDLPEVPELEEAETVIEDIPDIEIESEPLTTEDMGDPDLPDDLQDLPRSNVGRIALGDTGSDGGFPSIYRGRGKAGRGHGLRRGGGTRAVTETVDRGLVWLARVQERDGHWDAAKWGGSEDPTNCGVTGLALLSFLGAGHTDQEGKYKDNVRRALNWFHSVQRPNGHFGRGQSHKPFYEQGIATMAVCEAYAMGRRPEVGRMAQKAINRIIRAQQACGGFGYHGSTGRVDTSVTGWNMMAIKSARVAGLDVPAKTIRRCKDYIKFATYPDGRMGYQGTNTERPGAPYPPHDQMLPTGWATMTAIGALCRQLMGYPRTDPMMARACDHIYAQGVQLADLYYTYYATLVMFQMGVRSKYWRAWNQGFRDTLIGLQDKAGAQVGSWHPARHKWGAYGGRVYTTALAILSLEVYWRFLPIYKASPGT